MKCHIPYLSHYRGKNHLQHSSEGRYAPDANMEAENAVILAHLLTALGVGGLIGLERSYHGRPAGFRTHTLVCIASSALMLVTVYQGQWFPNSFSDTVRMTRRAWLKAS